MERQAFSFDTNQTVSFIALLLYLLAHFYVYLSVHLTIRTSHLRPVTL